MGHNNHSLSLDATSEPPESFQTFKFFDTMILASSDKEWL